MPGNRAVGPHRRRSGRRCQAICTRVVLAQHEQAAAFAQLDEALRLARHIDIVGSEPRDELVCFSPVARVKRSTSTP